MAWHVDCISKETMSDFNYTILNACIYLIVGMIDLLTILDASISVLFKFLFTFIHFLAVFLKKNGDLGPGHLCC